MILRTTRITSPIARYSEKAKQMARVEALDKHKTLVENLRSATEDSWLLIKKSPLRYTL